MQSKRAFTLIELLVVIAILAAILFPVFAQAKTAAKKAQSISNIKQMGASIMMYAGDYDDKYPRNDECILNSSLNTALNNKANNTDPSPYCSGSTSFAFRMNHYSWQKWLQPYTKNVPIYFHPVFQKDERSWNVDGEIFNGYALNLALTGAVNTWNRGQNDNGRLRNSFLGGSQTNIPDVAQAMLYIEFASTNVNIVPTFVTPNASEQTAYPPARKSLWIPFFFKKSGSCAWSNELDSRFAPYGGHIVLGHADGHAKAIPIRQFLANTPNDNQYTVSSQWSCGMDGGAWTISSAPVWTQPWPMWGLQ